MEKAENKKGIITTVAQKLFSRYGLIKTTVDEIAKAARMGKASLYHYFRSKEDIFREVIEKEGRILNEKIKEAIGKEKTPQGKLRAFVVTRMRYLSELANIYSALKDEYLDHYAFIEKAREKNLHKEIETIKTILREGIEKGIFVNRDIESTSFAIISALKGLEYSWSIKVPVPEAETNMEKLLEILFNGIVKK